MLSWLSGIFKRKPKKRLQIIDDEHDELRDLVISECLRTRQVVLADSDLNGTVILTYQDGTNVRGKFNDQGDLETNQEIINEE